MIATVLLVVLLLQFVASSSTGGQTGIPSLSFKRLQTFTANSGQNEQQEDLINAIRDGGGKIGAFAVTGLGPDYLKAVKDLRTRAPGCLASSSSYPVSRLSDGSTRRTFATQTGDDFPACLEEPLTRLSAGFDAVETAVMSLIENIAGEKLLYKADVRSAENHTMRSAPHKDHLHVYTRAKFGGRHIMKRDAEQQPGYLVPYHVDNGIFLLITPFPKLGLLMKNSDGSEVSSAAVADPDAVLALVGRGLEEWLLQGQPGSVKGQFHAVPHAVPSMKKAGVEHRTVFARMKVAPGAAVPVITPHEQHLMTFNDVFMGTKKKKNWSDDSQICSVDLKVEEATKDRDHFLEAMDSTCAAGEAYCWMGCYPLPDSCPTVDDAVCFSKVTNVTCSTEPDGKPMDNTCKWECKPKEKQSAYRLNDYCNGKMDMLMSGFEVSGNKKNPCIILFVEEWTLDCRWKFALACVGVLMLGFLIEALICLRRQISRRRRFFIDVSAPARKILILILFGLNLVLGYLAMLVSLLMCLICAVESGSIIRSEIS